jgi:hypothetical protein
MRPGVTHPTHSRHFHSENVPDTSNSADTFDSAPRGKEKRRFRVRGCGGLSKHREPRESDASVRLRVRSHVPGTRRDRAPVDEAGIRKAEPQIETPSVGVRLWAVFQRGSAHEPPPENVGRERDVARPQARRAAVRPGCASGLGCWTSAGYVRGVYAPEPPLRVQMSPEFRPRVISSNRQRITANARPHPV